MPNVNQIYDLFTPGIPTSFEMSQSYAEQAAYDAQQSAAQSEASASESALQAAASLEHASEAQAAADEAKAWATAKAGISLGPEEPPDATAGSVWLQTDGDESIVAFMRFEADAPGNGLFPGSTTYPGSNVYPNKMGDWSSYKLAAALVQ